MNPIGSQLRKPGMPHLCSIRLHLMPAILRLQVFNTLNLTDFNHSIPLFIVDEKRKQLSVILIIIFTEKLVLEKGKVPQTDESCNLMKDLMKLQQFTLQYLCTYKSNT
jgi:hypothetical protein